MESFNKTANRQLQGRLNFQGLEISIENRKGGVRKGVDPDGNEWRTKMKIPYGYIRRTEGADEDHIDCFVGPNKDSPTVYVVSIKDPKTDKYDEDKVMLGFDSKEEAEKAFRQHYDDPEKFLLDTRTMTMEDFKKKISSDFEKGKQTKLLKAADAKRYAIPAITSALLAMMGGGYGRLYDKGDSRTGTLIGTAAGAGLGLGGGMCASRLLSRALAGKGITSRINKAAQHIGSEVGKGFKNTVITEPVKRLKDKIFHPFGLFNKP